MKSKAPSVKELTSLPGVTTSIAAAMRRVWKAKHEHTLRLADPEGWQSFKATFPEIWWRIPLNERKRWMIGRLLPTHEAGSSVFIGEANSGAQVYAFSWTQQLNKNIVFVGDRMVVGHWRDFVEVV